MKKNVFSKSFGSLVIVLLLLSVLFPRELSQKLMLIAIVAWLLVLGICFLTRTAKTKSKSSMHPAHLFQDRQQRSGMKQDPEPDFKETRQASPSGDNLPPTHQKAPILSETEIAQMLQHIQLRITDKLKSAYADATWQWDKEPCLRNILTGETIRILVENMDKYTHADITFDRFGRIHVEPMIIGCFTPGGQKADEITPDETPVPEPAVVDVRVWYELIGQKILTEQITELNAKGHSKLTIKENGDITIKNQKNDVLKASLDSFPAKTYWQELVSVLAEDQLTAKITGNSLQVSWI